MKVRIGAHVTWTDVDTGKVLKGRVVGFGRDRLGVHTKVLVSDDILKVHPSQLSSCEPQPE